MKFHLIPLLIAILILTACSPTPVETLTAERPVSATSTPLQPMDTPAPPTEIPPIAETGVSAFIPQLSARSTFEVIAAIRAYVLIVGDWAAQDISPAERLAVIQPLAEFGIAPLNSIFDQYTPQKALAGQWDAAFQIYGGFYLSTSAWAVGETSDEEYQPILEENLATSQELIEQAAAIAEELSVDTTQYGPGYASAIQAANALLPEIAIQPLPEPPGYGTLNPALIPVQITAFVFDFAGSEIFYTIGTIENTSETPQQNVTIEVAYYNFLDEHIGTVRGRLLADIASPGGVYPFIATDVISGEEAALKDQTHYEAEVFSSPAEAESYHAFTLDLSTTDHMPGKFFVYGNLTNTGDQTLDMPQIQIGVAAYDADEILVGVGDTSLNLDGRLNTKASLAPGDSVPFSLIIQALAGDPVSYHFFAEVIESQ